MFVFYHKESGEIAFTINGASYPEHLVTAEIAVLEPQTPVTEIAGWKVIGGRLVQVSLEPLKTSSLARVSAGISSVRQRVITALPGQDMIYLRKEAEARAYLAASDPALADYPMIAAEVGVTAETAYQVAQVWIYMSQSWQALAASLEAIRLTTTNAIAAAADEAAVTTALTTFEATLGSALT